MASSSTSTPLQNIYYERKVATARPCYICKRPTETVLATLKTEDFLYTCDGHLSDPGFASPIAPPPSNSGPSPEDIRKVIADYHAREAKKASPTEKDAKESPQGSKNDTEGKDKSKSVNPGAEKSPAHSVDLSNMSNLPVSTASPPSTHRKYALHRQIFDMRRAEIKRKEQGVKAKEVSKGLPQVPRGAF
ncbi:VPS4-associated protein 1 [Kockovaella imperatae]|uniref:VPS4-associated protein 1 n=1 Tax=Kockovaella imperatae TaxID=4999 RepID=A0A1Y1UNJ1_9TREE|nr:VPS4-associated protein 1 [Kockovaella imperatae]ORX39579.1 VPS4-associated protein 1 [Kockovaella imperatae]